MARLTGGEALVKQLHGEGVRVVFGLPGVQLYGIVAALRDEPDLRFITVRHEGASSYMADGYARAGGGIGVAVVVPGPGLLNASAGLNTAYSASSPVLLIVGQIPRNQIGKKIGVLHELDNQLDALAGTTKWRASVLEVADAPRAVHEALGQLRSGRPRPVAIDMPWDTMEEEVEVELVPPGHPPRGAAPPADLERAAALLLAAKRPLIYAGGGVHLAGAHEALAATAEYLQAGVLTSAEGKGAVSDASDLSLGATIWSQSAAKKYLEAADVILAVGSRLALAAPKPDQQLIQIDVDPDEIGRNHAKTVPLVGDARATLEGLLEALRASGAARPSRAAEREALRQQVAATMTQEPNTSILRSLRAGTPEDAIVIAGMTQIGYFSRPYWPVYRPRTYLTSSYSGNLGFEYPTALGAKVAYPNRPVVMIAGDGGFMYYAQEMATAVQQQINVVAVVFNDNAFGNVARDLDEHWGGKFASELHNPDFVRLAEAYGMKGLRAKEPAEVGRVVADAIQLDRPVLIEVPVGRMARPVFFGPLKTLARYQR
ncbi:MAG: thiamine pyrophosphate-dependent enzyme [Candidatus Rokuibacteriota bacterium]